MSVSRCTTRTPSTSASGVGGNQEGQTPLDRSAAYAAGRMSRRRKQTTPASPPPALEAARAGAQQRLDAFVQRAAAGGTPVGVGNVLSVFPAHCTPLDHAAIAWAHSSGVPAPPTPERLGAELVMTTAGVAYSTFPVPYVWWRGWQDVLCSLAFVGRPRWRQGTTFVFVSDRVAPFEGRAFELPVGAAKAFMDFAMQRGAVAPGAKQ